MRFQLKNVLTVLTVLVLLPYCFKYAGAEDPAGHHEGDGFSLNGSYSGKMQEEVLNDGNSHHSDERKENALISFDLSPLGDKDFGIGGISLMDPLKRSIDLKGQPDSIVKGPVIEEYRWKGLDIRRYNPFLLKYTGREDLPSDFNSIKAGISEIRLNDGGEHTSRNIGIGSRREDILRSYGPPNRVFWNEVQGNLYFIYALDNREIDFSLKEGKISGIHVLFNDKNVSDSFYGILPERKKLISDKDFYIAGYKPGDRFNSQNSGNWEKKIANPKEEIWYYAGYAVRMSAKGQDISSLLLTDDRMVTSRGITLGDDISTVEAIYGTPHRMEMDISGSSPKTTYIYFSFGKNRILMFGFLNNKVDGVISALNPKN